MRGRRILVQFYSQVSETLICTPWRPRRPADTERWTQHYGAHEVGDQEDVYPGGDIVRMECRDCGAMWREELPR